MYGMYSLIRIRPSWVMSTLTALVVVLMFMDCPQTSLAQVDYPVAPPAPPTSGVTPPASAPTQTDLFPYPPPPVLLTPPAAQNLPTPSSPPPVLNAPPASSPEKWNDSFSASDFRDDSVPQRFVLWPENLPYVKFVYFCQQVLVLPKRNLTDFTYKDSATGSLQRLQTRPYFDLGLVDRYHTPYFRRWIIDWRVDIHRVVCPVVCEYTDLQRLYEYRLHRKVWLVGFAYGVVAVAILQLGVVVSIILLWVLNLDKVRCETEKKDKESQSLIAFLRDWCKHSVFWLDFVPDWVHLVLLAMVGFSMMEAAGHSNFFEWRSMLFYNFGVTYTWLTLWSVVSSILFQCAQFLSSRKVLKPILAQATDRPSSNNLSKKASTRKSGPLLEDSTASPPDDSTVKSSVDGFGNSVKEFASDDWKYQRIFGQIAVLILMSMYLLLVDDYDGKSMDSLASVIVGAIVVACIWSFAVASVVAVRSLRRIFNIACTVRYSVSKSESVSKSSKFSPSQPSVSNLSSNSLSSLEPALEPELEPAPPGLENC